MKKLILGLLLLLISTVASAQPIKTVEAVRKEYPARVTDPQIGAMTKEVARRLGPPYGILQKKDGRNCEKYSCDVICVGNGSEQVQIDLWEKSSQGIANPMWGVIPPEKRRIDSCVIIAPTPPDTPPPPEQHPVDLTPILDELKAIQTVLKDFEIRLQSVESQQSNLSDQLREAEEKVKVILEQQKKPAPKSKLDLIMSSLAVALGALANVR